MSVNETRTAPGTVRTWWIRLVLLATVVLVVLATGEIATRLFVPEPIWRFHVDGDDWRFDEQIGWVHRPNLDVTRARDGKLVRFRTNDDGVTPPTARRPRAPGVARVMLFGDSSVLGRWVNQDETIDMHLSRRLHSEGVVAEVINAGVEGYATDQVLLLMERLVPLYRPDVVGYGLHPNDFGGIQTREAYGNSKPMFTFAENASLELLPPPFRERRIQSLGARGLRASIQHSALYRLVQPFVTRLRARFGGWEHELLHGIDQESLYHRAEALERIDWRLLGALLDRMRAVSAEHGAKFFLYHHPDIGAVWDPYVETFLSRTQIAKEQYDRYAIENRLAALAEARGIPFCPVVAAFLANQARGPFHLLPRDYHCDSAGYQLTAEVIADFLIHDGMPPAGPGPLID